MDSKNEMKMGQSGWLSLVLKAHCAYISSLIMSYVCKTENVLNEEVNDIRTVDIDFKKVFISSCLLIIW